MQPRFHAWIAAILLGTCAHGALAAPITQLPPSAEPSRIDKRPQFDILPETGAPITVEEKAPSQKVPDKAREVFFTLRQLNVEGVTAYSPEIIKEFFANDIGKNISLARVFEIADSITQLYRNDGYFLSRAFVPTQKIEQGEMVLKVVEGYVETVSWQGDKPRSELTDAILQKVTEQRPLKVETLERALLLLNDLPGLSAKSIVEPLADQQAKEGGVGLVVDTATQSYRPSLSLDNYGSRFLGPYQATARLGMNNLFDYYNQTSLNGIVTSQTDELKYLSMSHMVPVNAEGTTVSLSASYADAHPGFSLFASDVESTAVGGSVMVSHPVVRSRTVNVNIGGELSFKNADTDVLNTVLYEDRLRIMRLHASMDNSDSLGGANFFSATVSRGFDVMGASETGSFNLSRARGHSDFTKLEVAASRLQALTTDFSAYGAVTAQYAWSPLLASEQFGYGGQAFGRAYDASEITGDYGVNAALEIRYSGLPEVLGIGTQVFAFYDVGQVRGRDSASTGASGASAGVGARFNMEDVSAVITVAQPLTREISTPHYGNGKNPRLGVSLNYRF